MPCQRPLMIEGQPIACRSCDYCVGRRVRGWCVRAMMEKDTHPACLVLALTYSEDTEHSRRSARMFDYKDVSDFLKRLRRQMAYHLNAKGALSFIAAGEQGDRFKRCHWHVVLFGQVDFLSLGEWRDRHGVTSDRANIVSPRPVGGDPSTVWRRNWSLWPHGFVTVQEPDYGGMRYAMAYALKDQFNVRNSAGTAREGRAEVFGTGYLVMSKKPPIGAAFVDRYVADCAARGIVPPTRKLVVPGVERPWWPTGVIAERLLAGLAAVNAGIKEQTGRDAAGWSTLLYEARESVDDLERLGVFDGEEDDSVSEAEDVRRQTEATAADNADARERGQKRRRCGSTEACTLCLRGLAPTNLEAAGLVPEGSRFIRPEDWAHLGADGEPDPHAAFRRRQSDGARKDPNPLCGLYGNAAIRAPDFSRVFPQSAAAEGCFAEGARCGKGV